MQANENVSKQLGDSQLFPLVKFLRDSWSTILVGGLAGGAVAAAIIANDTPQYEALAQVSMAQVPFSKIASGSINTTSVSIEEPGFLIERMKIPSTYTSEVINACGAGSPEAMAKVAIPILQRNAVSMVLVKVRRSSPELARQCAEALFDMVRSQQAAMIKPLREELKMAMAGMVRLRAQQCDLDRLKKQGLYESVFQAQLVESIFLNQQINALQNELRHITPTRLASPIYAGPNKVSPPFLLSLALGLLAGLFLGLMVAFGRTVFAARKTQ